MPSKKPNKNNINSAPAGASQAASFPVVGIGASAGGLAAFEAFFRALPPAPGMAFVLVQHLAPDHKSLLGELIRRCTSLPVQEAGDGMPVQPNQIYIIPPGRDLALLGGSLQLLEPAAPRGQRLPIDFFFRALALDQREQAVAIVLSGNGSDGSQGLRAIKAEGGLVLAQLPDSAEYDSMPRAALGSGLVDYELPPAEMPAQLMAYLAHSRGGSGMAALPVDGAADNALKKVFVLLRAQTGHDFSQYKPSTILRRIERRMMVQQLTSMDAYVKLLQQTPAEIEALFRDLLIGVTSFFRDPEAFAALETELLPALFEGKPPGSLIRVWTCGCSTGEEAYSIAMLLQERAEALRQGHKLQVFATDIDSRAIASARAGLYPASIAADVSPERLARFFTAEPDGSAYRIHKSIRDLLVFSEQDVVKDPPFSRLDLISCRNLMIYLGDELQRKLIQLFHYALLPGGRLFLGSSETVGEFTDLFATLDRKAKLYQRTELLHGAARPALHRFLPSLGTGEAGGRTASAGPAGAAKPGLREVAEQALLQQATPPSALVNAQGDILYLHGRIGRYLELAAGEAAVNNILRMAPEGVRRELSNALHKAVAGRQLAASPPLHLLLNGQEVLVQASVRPVPEDAGAAGEPTLYLVSLEELPTPEQLPEAATGADGMPVSSAEAYAQIAALNQELRAKEEYLQTANEELETSNEELKSSNEEMQSVNEELQSTNEELETSKEELQSVNEELATLNTELQSKVSDLSRVNNDMNNLLAGTGIATVFVDHQLRILRFTPAATRIINLILSDVGRPVGHIVSNLVGYESLLADVQAVLDSLVPQELDVRTREGKWYTMRIQPYRTLENVIEGAVLSFVDISLMKQTEFQLRELEQVLRVSLAMSPLASVVALLAPDGSGARVRFLHAGQAAKTPAVSNLPSDGLSLAQYLAQSGLQQADGSELPLEQLPLARALTSGQSCSSELRLALGPAAGPVRAQAAPVRLPDGSLVAAVMLLLPH